MLVLACCLLGVTALSAAPQTVPPSAPTPGQDRASDGKYETGRVTVKGGIATIDLPPGWRYLQQSEARRVIEQEWGNRVNTSTLGLVLPPAADNWGGVIVSFDPCGHVSDSDADEIDPDAILAAMKEQAVAGNVERRRAGFQPMELLGWAEPPRYDAAAKKIYWAKTIRALDGTAAMLNYDMRVLGADGVLVMQAVGDLPDLARVTAGAKAVLARTQLAEGKRYSDHDPSVHPVAAVTVGGLIGGKVAKVSLFRVVLKLLIVVGVAAAVVFTRVLQPSTAT